MNDPHRQTISARSALHAQERPDHAAILFEGNRITYADLHTASNRTAHALRAAGLGPGTRIGYLGMESEHFYTVALACAKAQTVLVPINWRLTAPEVDHILRDSGAELLFVDRSFRATAERVAATLPDMRTIITLDTRDDRGGGLAEFTAGHPDTDPDPDDATGDPLVQMYTSGTTGLPKGVVLAHRTFFTFIDAMAAAGADEIDWRPDDRSLICFPGLHSAGMAWFMHLFNVGATAVIMRMFVADEAVRLIREHRVTTVWAAPAMLHLMLSERAADADAFRSLRKIVYGGSPISPELMIRCIAGFGCDLAQMYAAAETGSVVTCLGPADHRPGNPKLGSAGRPCPGNDVRILATDGTALPAGEIGQVALRTPAHFVEYWRRPDATAQMLVDGWLMMGDAGYLDEDGYLFLCDRMNDTIIIAGQNIYPVEVENAIREHPDVADVAVYGVPDPRWGEVAHACVIRRPDTDVSGRDLIRFLHGRLADFKIPTGYRFAADLPRNPTGKVLRRVLRDEHSQEPQAVS